jgi:hypothetical protein
VATHGINNINNMRTKALVLTAVLGLAGIANSLAQGAVYSVNAVGYVNVTLNPGFTMIANPLDNKNANGNTISNLFAGVTLTEGSTIYQFDPVSGTYSINTFEFGAWGHEIDTLLPGGGAFFLNKGAAVTVTFVGEVKQGVPTPLSTPLLAAKFQILSSQVPQKGQLDTDLKFPVKEGDTVYRWVNGTGQYTIHTYEFGAWGVAPVPEVGESFFFIRSQGAAENWTRAFDVNTPGT